MDTKKNSCLFNPVQSRQEMRVLLLKNKGRDERCYQIIKCHPFLSDAKMNAMTAKQSWINIPEHREEKHSKHRKKPTVFFVSVANGK